MTVMLQCYVGTRFKPKVRRLARVGCWAFVACVLQSMMQVIPVDNHDVVGSSRSFSAFGFGQPQGEVMWSTARGAYRLFVASAGLGLGFLAGSFVATEWAATHANHAPDLVKLVRWTPVWCVLLVSVYIGIDLGVFITTDIASEGYIKESAALMSNITTWSISVALSLVIDGLEGAKKAVDIRQSFRLLPVAGCFALSLLGQLNAIVRLSPVLVKVLFQLKLPGTILLSTALFGHRYSFLQINALATVFLAVTAFTCLKVGTLDSLFAPSANGKLTTAASGFGFAFLSVGCNVMGSLLSEKALCEDPTVPVYITMARIKVGEIIVCFMLMSLKPGAPLPLANLAGSPMMMFAGFDWSVWRVVFILALDSWASAVIVKNLSCVIKAISKCLSLIVLYVLSVCVFKTEPFLLPQMILAAQVINGIGLFTYSSNSNKNRGVRNGERS